MATADVLLDDEVDDPDVPKGYARVNGELWELPVSEKSGWVGAEILYRIRAHLERHPQGRVYLAETGYRCFPTKPRQVRKPDVSFIRAERLSPELSDRDITIPPDLVVEVISPNETALDLDDKIRDYQSVGVPLIWVVNPNARTVRIIRPTGSPPLLTDADTLTGEDVLPGFSCRVADFLPPVAAAAP
jgi:Uma2 family endonuclease